MLDNSCFLCRNFGKCVPEDRHMVKTNFCDDSHIRHTAGIRGVIRSTKSGLQNHNITLLLLKIQQCHRKTVIKHRRINAKIHSEKPVSKARGIRF